MNERKDETKTERDRAFDDVLDALRQIGKDVALKRERHYAALAETTAQADVLMQVVERVMTAKEVIKKQPPYNIIPQKDKDAHDRALLALLLYGNAYVPLGTRR